MIYINIAKHDHIMPLIEAPINSRKKIIISEKLIYVTNEP